jgi:hypothetical protein
MRQKKRPPSVSTPLQAFFTEGGYFEAFNKPKD